MSGRRIVLGTRGSELALRQAEWVKAALGAARPGLEVELRVVQTTGDKILDTALSKIGDKGLFTKEIENELLAGGVDMAVHSLKDLPTKLPAGLEVGAITVREDAADVLVSKEGLRLEELPEGGKVLSGSLRRKAQLLHGRGDLEVRDVRGNVHTRLRKLDEGDACAMVMAAAGLKRLGLAERIGQRLEPGEFLPACGQGALAVEIRSGDAGMAEVAAVVDDATARVTTRAERAVLAALEGGCQVPMGAYAEWDGRTLGVRAMIADLEGERLVRAQARGVWGEAEKLGRAVAEELLKKGGREILDEIERGI